MNLKIGYLTFITIIFLGCNAQTNPSNKKMNSSFSGSYSEFIQSAAIEDTLGMLNLLSKGEINLNYSDKNSSLSLLNWCIINNKPISYEFLLKKGANPNYSDTSSLSYYPPAVIMACSRNCDSNTFLLNSIKYRGDVNLFYNKMLPERDGISLKAPIYAAISKGCLGTIKKLLENGADINLKKDSLATPLAYSIIVRKLDIALYLLENGSDYKDMNFYTIDKEKQSIFDLLNKINASTNTTLSDNKEKIVAFLKSKK